MNHHGYHIFPLGDSAITVDFGNTIDEMINRKVISLFDWFSKNSFAGLKEIVPAYSTLTFHYNITVINKIIPKEISVYDWVKTEVEKRIDTARETADVEGSLVDIPVCYETLFAPDIEQLARSRNISIDEVIQLHSSGTYRVYMLGFLPGFAYLGQVDEKIAMPRKPRLASVTAGSIGIAGLQTGIYPFASPGGWQIIGRTPLNLFDVTKEDPALLKTGDTVRFYSISSHEFANY